MRIGQLSTRTGASIRSLRYYEEQHLLAPERTLSDQRIFSDADVDRVRQILRLLDAGLGTARIRELLPCVEALPSERTSFLREHLIVERDRLSARIDSLLSTRQTLDELIAEVTSPDRSVTCSPFVDDAEEDRST